MTLVYHPEAETQVNTYTTGAQYYPNIVALSGGGYVIVWASFGQDGSDYGIYAQMYDATGAKSGSEFRVSTTTANIQSWPDIAPLSNGGFVVVWHSLDQDASGTYGIYSQRYDSSGTKAGTETLVNTTTAGEQSFAEVATLSAGGYVVVWQSSDGNGFGIYMQRYTSAGVKSGSETLVNTTTTSNQRNAGVTALSGGGYVVAWDSNGNDGSDYGVVFQVYDASGTKVGSETLANTTTSDAQQGAVFSALSGGGFAALWYSNLQDGSGLGVYMQRFTATGTKVGSETRVNTTTANDQAQPALTVLSDGSFIVAWASDGQDGSSYGIYAQKFTSAGVKSGGETRINTTTADSQTFPAMTSLSNGDYVFAWASNNQDGSGTGIYKSQYAANNTPALTASQATLAHGNEDTAYAVTTANLTTGFTDGDSEALTVTGLTADHGTVTDNHNGTFTITPVANYNGTMILSYSVTDGVDSVAATLSYTVDAVNDAPTGTASGTVANGTEDTTQTLQASGLLAGFSDVENDSLSISVISADHGTVTDNGDGTFTFTPAANYNGLVTLSYTVSDGHGGTVDGTRSFTLAAVNDAPTGAGTATLAAGSEDSAYTVQAADLLAGFSDVENDTLSISAISSNHGAVVSTGDGSFTVTPTANYNGAVTLSYTVSDGHGGTVDGTRSFTLAAVNDAPAGTPSATLGNGTEDTDYIVQASDLLAGLSDAEDDDMTVIAISTDHGTVSDNGDGTWTLAPTADYHGRVVLTYSVSDGTDTTTGFQQSLTLATVNDAPAGTPSANLGNGTEDTDYIIQASDLLTGLSDAEGDEMTITAISADHGTVSDNGNGTWTLVPTADYHGRVVLTYSVSDGTDTTTGLQQSLTLATVNDAPAGTPSATLGNGTEDTDYIIQASDLLTGLSDAEGGEITVTAIRADHGTVSDNGDGTWTLVPTADYHGQVVLTYSVSDGTDTATGFQQSLILAAANDAPAGTPSATLADGSEDTDYIIQASDLLIGLSDVDGDEMIVTDISADHGTVTDNGDGTWTLVPTADYHGKVVLTYNVSDGTDTTTGLQQSLTLATVNDAPAGTPSATLGNGTEDTDYIIQASDLLIGLSDVDGDEMIVTAISADHGTVSDNGDGTWTLAPTADHHGTVTLTYSVSDGTATKTGLQQTFVLTSVNDGGPVGTPSATLDNGTEDTDYILQASDLLAGLSDVDGDRMEVTAVTADHGTVTDNGDGTWSVTPESDYNGQVVLTYSVSDGTLTTTGLQQSFTLIPVNDGGPMGAPTGSVADGTEDRQQTILAADLLAGFSDIDGDTLSVSAIAADHGTLTAATGGWTFTPEANYNGAVVLTYTVSDGQGGTLEDQTRGFSLGAVNDAPAGTPTGTVADGSEDTNQTILATTLLAGFSDVDGDSLSISAISANHGTLTATTGGWTFTPPTNYNGAVTLSYTVSDGHGGTSEATRSFNLAAVNDAPKGTPPVLAAGTEDVTYTVTGAQLRAGFSDIDGDAVSITDLTAEYSQGYVGGTVNTYANRFFNTNDSVALAGGGSVFMFRGYNNGYVYHVVVNDAGGTTVKDLTLGDDQNLVALNDGSFVALSVRNYDNYTRNTATHYSATGTVINSSVDVSTTSYTYKSAPTGVALASGGYLLSWSEQAVSGNTYQAYARAFNADGTQMGALMTLGVSSASSTNVSNVYLSAHDDGSFVAVWQEFGNPTNGTRWDVYSQRFAADGTALGGAYRVNTTSAGEQEGPSVSVLDGGGYVITWRDNSVTKFMVYDVSGSAVGGEHTITGSANPITNYGQRTFRPEVVGLSDGGFVIATGYPDSSGNGVAIVRYDALGNQLGAPVSIAADQTGEQVTSQISLRSDGSLLLVWDEGGVVKTRVFAEGTSGDATVTYNAGTDTYSITRPADFNGLLKINYTVSDGHGGTLPVSSTIGINAVNDVPTGAPTGTVADGSEDTQQTILLSTLVAGFSDVEGDTLSVSSISSNHGTLSGTTGGWIFTPTANYNGSVTLTYTVSDGHGGTIANQTRNFTLAAVNDAPALTSAKATLTGTEDTAKVITLAQLKQGYSDVDGDTLSVSTPTANHGTVVDNGDDTWTLAPEADYNGVVVLSYTVSDGHGGSLATTLNVTLAAVNDAPRGTPTGTVADGSEDTTQVILAATLLSGISDVEGNSLTVSAISADHGTLTATTGGWTFTPAANYNGPVVLTYTVSDGQGGTLTGQTRSFTLSAVNDAPTGTATGTVAAGSEDTVQSLQASDLLAGFSDVDHDDLTISAISADHGDVVNNGDGTLTFTPSTDYNGVVVLSYTVSDSHGGTVAGTRSFTLASVNDEAPRLTGTPAALSDGTEDTTYTVTRAQLLEGWTDYDSDPMSVLTVTADHGTVVANGNNTWTVTPTLNHNGLVTLSYSVSDSAGGVTPATQTFTLAAVNDAPTGAGTASLAGGTEDTDYIVQAADLLQGFSDVDNDTLSISAMSSNHGAVVDNNDGTFTVTPSADYYGAVTLTYTVSDGHGGTVGGSRSFTLIAVNDAPRGTPTGTVADGSEDTTQVILATTLLAGLSDVEDEALSISAIEADHGSLVATTGGWVFTPAADYNGAVTLTYTVSDGHGGTLSGQTRTFNLASVNDGAPARTGSAATLVAGTEDVVYSFTGTDLLQGWTDVDSDHLAVSAISANHGSVSYNAETDTYSLTPAADYFGTVVISYTVFDGTAATASSLSFSLAQVVDTVTSTTTTVMGPMVENLNLTGGGDIDATGNALGNIITGNSGRNVIDGGLGSDTMAGGGGDDTYYVHDAGDSVIEDLNQGIDLVYASVDYTLGGNVESLVLTGTAINGTGNALANRLTGNAQGNVLNGLGGADTMTGGAGDDTYYADVAGDVIVELADGGNDTVITSRTVYGLAANTETLVYRGTSAFTGTGNALANTISTGSGNDSLIGGDGNDTLNGMLGADTMNGGNGDDLFYVDNAGDAVVETGTGGGYDTVRTYVTYSMLSLAANVEALILNGTDGIGGTGNDQANVITGNDAGNALNGAGGDDLLDGRGGNDSMAGGTGNDTYYVEVAGDTVTEAAGEGTDAVYSAVSYVLTANVETLVLTKSAATGDGNASDNTLTGNAVANVLKGYAGNDIIDGRGGRDTMCGGTGDDVYYVDNTFDKITENAGEGYDAVRSTVNWTLGDNVERLTLYGTTGLTGTGNVLDNLLTGNSGGDQLYGLGGNDALDGGLGDDSMYGGTGDDRYYVDSANDLVVELPGGGTDNVRATVSYALTDNVEVLALIGTGDLWGTGNGLDNTIGGTSGNNVLHGGAGNDTLNGGDGNDWLEGDAGNDLMVGGLGNDSYVIDSASDIVRESADSGIDSIYSSITAKVATNAENLYLTGSGNIDATGNAGNNIIGSNSGNNKLTGGLGADIFLFGLNNGQDIVADFHTAEGDSLNITGYGGYVVTQAGKNVLIDMGHGNTITVLNMLATDAVFLASIHYSMVE